MSRVIGRNFSFYCGSSSLCFGQLYISNHVQNVINFSVQDSILNCTQSHKAFWKCLQVHKEYSPATLSGDQSGFHQVVQKFIDDKELNPWHDCDYYDTRLVFPNQTRSEEDETKINEHLQYLKSVTNLDKPLHRTCFV